ncbi:antitoxin ParD1/3/4 [Myroides guanonis]|uniref:Antitoxin ParD1/3/4 n=2 Tax=Myroides guanonis TaxID=1150112 RepID=A0A1I3LKF1_9FLAO|nr:antitoxin ParD1/3/4 [Myroides guanonis]
MKLYEIPTFGTFDIKIKIMAKNTSILLGDYFDKFINEQVQSGKFSSASEVVRAALRIFEYEETKKSELIKELKKGEESGFVKNFDREELLKSIHQKYVSE